MAVDAILVLQASDVARLAAAPARLAGARLLFVDAAVLEEAALRGLTRSHRYEYRPLNLGPDTAARTAGEALARATLLDLQLAAERERLWGGSDLALAGWDVNLFFPALRRAALARLIGRAVTAGFPERRIGLLRPRHAQQMHFDSFVSTDLVAHDTARFAIVDRYRDARSARADALDQVLDAHALSMVLARGATLVSHVPGCYGERAWLAEQVARSHLRTLDLPSPCWDLPLLRGATVQVARSSLAAEAEVADYGARVVRVIEPLVADLLPRPRAREEQVTAWAARARWQALNFLQLKRAFARFGAGTAPPLLLSDLDSGLLGPLFSLALRLRAAVTVVPHDGALAACLPHARRVVVAEAAGHGSVARTLLGQPVQVRRVRGPVRLPRRPLGAGASHPARRLCLLIESLDGEGQQLFDVPGLADFVRLLHATCQAAGVELMLRPRPGTASEVVLGSALAWPAQELTGAMEQAPAQIAPTCDLALVWGRAGAEVTTFVDAGTPVLRVAAERGPPMPQLCLPLVADGVLPTLRPAEALATVRRFIDDGRARLAEAARQCAALDARAAGAHDHLFERELAPADHAPA
ncbi:MAG: hypothetical protein JNJ89_12345 [Rubrivivax sp.]|nr:hypothetical protein [Rubrivivax sp.]